MATRLGDCLKEKQIETEACLTEETDSWINQCL